VKPYSWVVEIIQSMGADASALLQRTLSTVGARQSESKISAQAQEFWNESSSARWKANSHWRDACEFEDDDSWSKIGVQHLAMFRRGARMVEFDRPWGRVVEGGCGGGANAMHFAPQADQFIGVDVSTDSLDECGRQVAEACGTHFRPVLVDVSAPEDALRGLGPSSCNIFLSFYVFELIPTPEYGERLLRIAYELLSPGGLALIQIKYDVGRWRTKPRRRAYRSGVAQMTTYTIDAFWQLAARCGLKPESIELVPKNNLGERYAYFLLSKER
jgi:SAM-dependent methyltransferase